MMLRAFLFILMLFIVTPALAGDTVLYRDGTVVLEGYLARAETENAPVVLIVHQWKGLGAYEKSRADMLAAAGYNAFAIDMYGQGVRPSAPEEAGAQAGKYKNDPVLARGRLNAALDFAKALDGVDPSRIAIMGYCFGGTMALELARSGADIDAACRNQLPWRSGQQSAGHAGRGSQGFHPRPPRRRRPPCAAIRGCRLYR
jgi:alpha-beta hydrolase superfamily lysophospholipase